MKLLDESRYSELIEPVSKINFNTLFAEAVIEHKIKGAVLVDDPENPKTFYVVHPYGMTLLFGDSKNEKFNHDLRAYALNTDQIRDKHEWMQAFPNTWNDVLANLFGDTLIAYSKNAKQQEKGIIELNARVNFKFEKEKFERKTIDSPDIRIIRTNKEVFREMPGSVVPAYFWETAEDFLSKGIGFSLYYKGKLASTAYSSCINATQLELGIETAAKFRRMGFAKYVCRELIDYCIENTYEPVWACRLENTASYKLAQELGFRPSIELPYYRLSK